MPPVCRTGGAPRERYLTGTLPGTGGRIRDAPDDFLVEEIPLSPPEGSGEHLYVRIEKRGLPTLEAARRLGVPERDIGLAGMKDARAMARQWLSFRSPGGEAERRLAREEDSAGPALRVLDVTRGRAKLRRGAHRGNRFEIRIRETVPGGAEKARAILGVLAGRGVPNAFVDQRFGARGDSAEVGRALALGDAARTLSFLLGREGGGEMSAWLREARRRFGAGDFEGARRLYPGGWKAERAVLARLSKGEPPGGALRAIPRRERLLFASAFQAALFNACLARRLAGEAMDRLFAGDVVYHHRTGKDRRIGDPAGEAEAALRFEVSPAGPLFGERTLEAGGEAGRIEAEILRAFGIAREAAAAGLARLGARGGRRPYRVQIEGAGVEEKKGEEEEKEGPDLLLRFTLPPGAYATEVLREVMKTAPPVGEEPRLAGAEEAENSLRGRGGMA